MKARKKTVIVETIQYNNLNREEIETFVGKKLTRELESETAYLAGKGAPIFSILIETKEGIMKAFPNDWIIKEPFPTGDRDFYPCKNDIFAKTYDVIDENTFGNYLWNPLMSEEENDRASKNFYSQKT